MSHRDHKKRRPSRLLHRWLGFLLLLPLLLITVTGFLLNHADELGWNRKKTSSNWLLSHYGMALEGEPVTYQADGVLVSAWEGQLFWNGQALPAQGELVGAVDVAGTVAVVSPRVIRLYQTNGTLMEALGELSLPEGTFLQAGESKEGRLVVSGENQSWVFGKDFLDYADSTDDAVRWAEPVPTPEPVREAMQRNYRGEGLPWSRVLLDLHSGRFFGTAGRWIVDVFALLVIVLAVTGLIVGIRAIRQGNNGHRHGS